MLFKEDSKYFIAIFSSLWKNTQSYSVSFGRISRISIFMEKVDYDEIRFRCF